MSGNTGSARQRILELFLKNVGKKVTKEQIREVAQINEWARRVREIRDEYGYPVLSYKDLPEQLKPGEYILKSDQPNPKAKERKIGKDQYYRILDRDGHICLACGAKPGDKHPINSDRTIRLVVDHIYPISEAEKYNIDPYSDENLQTLCDFCNEGKWNKFAGPIGNTVKNLSALVRHAAKSEQLEIYNMLKEIFE